MSEKEKKLFQAIGVISGEIQIIDDSLLTIKINNRSYDVKCPKKRSALAALKAQIEQSCSNNQTLIVYPKCVHFPKPEQPYKIYFELVGHKGDEDKGLFEDCNVFEFKLAGIWQFIPVSRTPCISIFKNFNRDRLDYIKSAPVTSKVGMIKAAHLPLIWQDAIVSPFKFNPKLPREEQATKFFVQIKAKFLPEKNLFIFDSFMGVPSEEMPNFFKASKKDKATANNEKKKQQREKTKNQGTQKKPEPPKPKPQIKPKTT